MGCHLIFSVKLLLVLQTLFLFEVKTDEVSDLLEYYSVGDKCKIIDVLYGDTEVHPGDHLSPELTLLPPSVSWKTNPFYKYYTLFLLDPDAFSTEVPDLSDTQFVHWCVTNIIGDDVDSGTVLAEYFPPLQAPPGMELHNFIYLLYNHNYKKNCRPVDRTLFNIEEYADECQLGSPVGYNHFKSGKSLQDTESDVSSLL